MMSVFICWTSLDCVWSIEAFRSSNKGGSPWLVFVHLPTVFYVRCSSLCLFKHAQSTWNTLQAKWTVCFSLSLFDEFRNSSELNLGRHPEGKDSPSRTLEAARTLFLPKLALTRILLWVPGESRISLGLKVHFWKRGKKKQQKKRKKIPIVDFHVSVLSKLCLWLSLFVFD